MRSLPEDLSRSCFIFYFFYLFLLIKLISLASSVCLLGEAGKHIQFQNHT